MHHIRSCLLPLLILAACDAGHIGNPLTLPARGIATAFENAAYNAQRREVKAWIAANEPALRAENFDGPKTAELLSTLPKDETNKVKGELRDAALHPDFIERTTVIVMVHKD